MTALDVPLGRTRPVVLVACLSGALGTLDAAVNIAFPAIVSAFDVEVASLQWVVVSYVLVYAVLLLPFGRLADRAGHWRVLIAGLALLAGALAACGLATGFPLFLAFRVAQGVGIALVLAAAPAIITLAVAERDRARALARFQMSVAAGFAVGPALGGVLLQVSSWRAVYLFRVPVAIGVLALAVWLRHAGTSRATPTSDSETTRWTLRDLDLPGALTFALGLAAALFVASRGSELGWLAPSSLALSALAMALLAGFVAVEHRVPAPLVDLTLFRNRAFATANVLNALANATMFAIWLLGPTLLVTVRGHGTIPGGLLLGATAAGTAATALVAGRLTSRVALGPLSTAGLALETLGLFVVSRLDATTATAVVVGAFALVGAGLGLFQVPNLNYVMATIPRSQQGVAGGMAQMVRTAGVVGGVAVANVIFAARQHAYAQRSGLAEDTGEVFVRAFRDVLLAATLLCAAATVLSSLRSTRPAVYEPAAASP